MDVCIILLFCLTSFVLKVEGANASDWPRRNTPMKQRQLARWNIDSMVVYCLWQKKLLPTSLLTVREMNELLRWKIEVIVHLLCRVLIDVFQNALIKLECIFTNFPRNFYTTLGYIILPSG